jgi:hypothetical protein
MNFSHLIGGLDNDNDSLTEFRTDPIALACASRELWLKNPAGGRWHNLNHMLVTDHNLSMAKAIRKYYQGRITVSVLKQGNRISEFRRKLLAVVNDAAILPSKDIGLIYRLPYFYAEDLVTDSVIEQTQSAKPAVTQRITDQFRLVATGMRSIKSGDYTQFWLRSQNFQPQAAWQITVKKDNVFHSLITSVLRQPVTLSGWAHAKKFGTERH